MRRSAALVVFALLLFFFLAPIHAFAFRCGSRLVSIGETKADVLNKCGTPNWEDSWQEKRVQKTYDTTYPTNGSYPRSSVVTVVYVTIDEWTYNFGPSYFMRTLRFENNRLVDIRSGDYGF